MIEQSAGGSATVEDTSQVRTFLIADIRGYTRFTLEHGDAAAAELASRFATVASESVEAHEGQVTEVRGDEALAVFSSARQALRASVDLQGRFQVQRRETSLPLQVGIGLDSGEAIPVADGYRGAALNLAARLCALAGPGEVLASDTVANLARRLDGITYLERGLVELKGFADFVRIVQVLPAVREPESSDLRTEDDAAASVLIRQRLPIGGFLGSLPSGPLVGREIELNRVLAAVDSVMDGDGRLVLLAGEPGVGKTRLAQQVTVQLRNRGFLVAAGRCYEQHENVPYYPFLEVLRQVHVAAPAGIRSNVSTRWPYLARLIPEELREVRLTTSDSGEEQQRLFRAVAGFIQAVAEQMPLGLLLDDIHWSDSASLQLLEHLARETRLSRVFILATYRDVEVGRQHPLEQALRQFHREALDRRISLKRLDKQGTAAYMAFMFDETEISEEFAELVHRQTEGNPFYTQEVLRSLIERGDVFREDGHWDRRSVMEIQVPESVRSVIGERVSRLPADAQEVLKEASVLGQSFEFDTLQAVGNRGEDQLENALQEAIGSGLLRETGRDGYSFSHALVQGTLYGELPTRRKRRLHLAVGEALEGLPEPARTQRAAELAWHFLEGDEPQKGFTYSLLAGNEAEALYAHAEAEGHYTRAVELARETENRPGEAIALERLGGVLGLLAGYEEAIRRLESAIALYDEQGDDEGQRRSIALIGRFLGYRAATDEGIKRLQEAVERLSTEEPTRGLAELYGSLAGALFSAGRFRDQAPIAERAVQIAEAVKDERLIAAARMRHATSLQALGGLKESQEILEDLIPLAERMNDLDLLAYCLHNASECAYLGQFKRAREYRERDLELVQRLGDPAHIGFREAFLGQVLFLMGDWQGAREHCERGVRIFESVGVSWFGSYPLIFLGQIELAEGLIEIGIRHVKEGLEIVQRTEDTQGIYMATFALANNELFEGRPAQVLDRLQKAMEVFREHAAEGTWDTSFLPLVAMGHLDLGDPRKAEEVAREALAGWCGTVGMYRVQALRSLGTVMIARSRFDEATEAFEEALNLARSMPWPEEEALNLRGQAVLFKARGESEKARGRLLEALEIFERLGAMPQVERTREVLGL